ncbi:168_t:CDS:2 [Funneliformis geosporum]|nr:168_t:CDS:2 [Funneliformis geosporum]
MKKLIVFSRTSNEGLNTMANLKVSTTSRSIGHKKRMFNSHREYVEKALAKI